MYQPSRLAQAGFAGLVGGLVGSFAMNLFARTAAAVGGGREAPGSAPGADRFGRGVQPPQSVTTADQDATVKAGTTLYEAVSTSQPEYETQQWLGTAAHFAFGGGAGLVYGLLSARAPALTKGYGTFYGALVWAVADEGVIPALGLSRRPGDLRPAVHAYALLGHFVYGVTLEAVRRYSADGHSDTARRLRA